MERFCDLRIDKKSSYSPRTTDTRWLNPYCTKMAADSVAKNPPNAPELGANWVQIGQMPNLSA